MGAPKKRPKARTVCLARLRRNLSLFRVLRWRARVFGRAAHGPPWATPWLTSCLILRRQRLSVRNRPEGCESAFRNRLSRVRPRPPHGHRSADRPGPAWPSATVHRRTCAKGTHRRGGADRPRCATGCRSVLAQAGPARQTGPPPHATDGVGRSSQARFPSVARRPGRALRPTTGDILTSAGCADERRPLSCNVVRQELPGQNGPPGRRSAR